MRIFGSLTNRIAVAMALLAVLSIAAAIYIVNISVTSQAEGELHRGLTEAGALLDENNTVLFEHFKREARLIADLPRLKAAVSTADPATVLPTAREYSDQLGAALFVVTDGRGRLLARIGDSELPDGALSAAPAVKQAASGREVVSYWPVGRGILQVVSVPIWIDRVNPEILGTLSVASSLDEHLANRFKPLTNSEVAFGMDGRIQAATLPESTWAALAPLLHQPGRSGSVVLDGNEYVWVTRPLTGSSTTPLPSSIILRSRTERLQFLRRLHTRLAGTALIAVFGAIVLSYVTARTVTRPLAAITATMKEMAATGDLTRKIPVPAEPRGYDEDARLLATTFNTMTASIAKFQHEATERERLSSLGRLSTVIAHEIRNPLMIIKTALRPLRREDPSVAQVKVAIHDIDEEIARLNRIVSEVLDFARPIKFVLADTDLNALVADVIRSVEGGCDRWPVHLDLDSTLPLVATDADRLRQALMNVVGNAVQAVGDPDGTADERTIRLATRRIDGHRAVIIVRDRGTGIAPEDLPRIFDPYFTTRRTGTGIGLAITRNIIEGLGGRITVASEHNRGTEVRIELPLRTTSV